MITSGALQKKAMHPLSPHVKKEERKTLTTSFPITMINRKTTMHKGLLVSCMHSHMFSIHSPQRMRNTTRKERYTSPMCQRRKHGTAGPHDFVLFLTELNLEPKSCMPTTEKMKTTMARTTVRFPRAPTEWPIIFISVFKVGQDLANLKTLSCKNRQQAKVEEKPVTEKFHLLCYIVNDMFPKHRIYDFQKSFQSQLHPK